MWNRDATEVISAHSEPRFEIKLWQIDKIDQKDKCSVPYWFTKVKDFTDSHSAPCFKMCLSPSGEYVCALSLDETISMWKLFAPDSKKKNY